MLEVCARAIQHLLQIEFEFIVALEKERVVGRVYEERLQRLSYQPKSVLEKRYLDFLPIERLPKIDALEPRLDAAAPENAPKIPKQFRFLAFMRLAIVLAILFRAL